MRQNTSADLVPGISIIYQNLDKEQAAVLCTVSLSFATGAGWLNNLFLLE
jgi:hypothetical protein